MSRHQRHRDARPSKMAKLGTVCPACRENGYPSRRAARAAARTIHPGAAMREYLCGGLWHITSQPPDPR